MTAMNRQRGAQGELCPPRFFDRALRAAEEYNGKVEYIHMNPLRAGLAARPRDWNSSSVHERSGVSGEEQRRRCGLTIDRLRMPSDPRTRSWPTDHHTEHGTR
jgi:hypothetical protein